MQERSFSGHAIKKGLDSLDVLGIALKQLVIEHIEKNGFMLDEEHTYTLREIEMQLTNIFGEDVARLIIARTRLAADAA